MNLHLRGCASLVRIALFDCLKEQSHTHKVGCQMLCATISFYATMVFFLSRGLFCGCQIKKNEKKVFSKRLRNHAPHLNVVPKHLDAKIYLIGNDVMLLIYKGIGFDNWLLRNSQETIQMT